MELYHKKINIENKQNKRGRDRNIHMENNPNKNIYIQKMIQQSQPKNEVIDLSSAGDNIHNIRTNMEEIFSNEENKKKAIKYVIEIGKNKNIRNSPRTADRCQKSVSPNRRDGGNKNTYGNVESFKVTPNRTYYNSRGFNTNNRVNPINENNSFGYASNTASNFYKPNKNIINNYNRVYNNPNQNQNLNPNQKYNEGEEEYINPEESQNEYELSSINNIDDRNFQPILTNPGTKFSRSPEPRLVNQIPQILKEKYQNASHQQNYPYNRNKDIQLMPKQKKQKNNYNNVNPNIEDEIDELVKTIDDMQSVINGQKNQIKNNVKDINRKNKEINFLKNELNNMQKELDEKRIEHDKEMENIFNNNNNTKLKNE